MQSVPGVTFVEWSRWTENMLVLFNPLIVSEGDLLAAMVSVESVSAANGVVVRTVPVSLAPAPQETRPAEYVTGWQRAIYQALGWMSVGMAVVGFALPGIPGAPFVVLAGYFFIRSSPEAHAWLLRSRWFGPILRDWEQHRAIRRSLKYTAIGLIAAAFVIVLLSGLPTAVVGTILVLEVIGMTIVVRLPVVEETPALPEPSVG
jgi:uncharacterized membrane protein YbaN (DUF454 family)